VVTVCVAHQSDVQIESNVPGLTMGSTTAKTMMARAQEATTT
jgi:hypothetical protein